MTYFARRLVLGLATLWLVTLVSFMLLQVAPGDAVSAAVAGSLGEGGLTAAQIDQQRRELGLDRSWPVQYASWLGGMLRLDGGTSLATGRPVFDHLGPRVAVTVELALFAVLFSIVFGISGGLAGARMAGTAIDTGLRSIAFLTLSVPTFWIALLLIVAVASWTGHFLALGFEPLGVAPRANLVSVLPAALVLALRPGAILMRMTRASTIGATQSNHFVFARSKGVALDVAFRRHGFRTALLPVVTVIGAETVFLLGGAVVVEQVFGLPGLGRSLVSAVLARDFPVVQALTVIFAVSAVGMNLLVDIMYTLLDPRLRGGA
jgi:peptide/nickel transport system permease protein